MSVTHYRNNRLLGWDVRARIPFPTNPGQIRRLDLPVSQSVPINFHEPRMSKYIAGPITHVSITSTRIMLHKLEDQVGRIGVKGRPLNASRALGYLLVENNRVGLGLVERRKSRQHFKDEDAECVPINGLVIPRVGDDL